MTGEIRQRQVEKVIDSLRADFEHALSFKDAFKYSLLPSAILSKEGVFQEVNQAICTFFGLSAAELRERTWQDLTVAEDLEKDMALATECLEGIRDSYALSKRYIHSSGRERAATLYVVYLREKGKFFSQIKPEGNFVCESCPSLKH